MDSGSKHTPPKAVLVYGSDEALLGTRTMVLEKAGFRVLSSLRLFEAEAIIKSGEITLVVLCHSLATEDCEAALDFSSGQNPPVRTLVLTAGESKCSEHSDGPSVSAFEGPRKLLETVRQLVC